MATAEFHFSPRPNRAHEVGWRPWSEAAFEEARRLDKPILLSISAVWCHWCHVMDETTYSNQGVIDLIKSEYVPVRVDNDVRPDINQRYNMGGWPTTAFLTPGGDILTGGTYVPPDQMAGALDQVASYYRTHRAEIATRVLEGRKRSGSTAARSAGEVDFKQVDAILDAVRSAYDTEYGGFGPAPKFPQTDSLALLLEQAQVRGEADLRQMAVHTLEKMAGGGMYDHVEGGFFRYSNCGDNTLSRIDIKTNKVTATLPIGPANSEGGIATTSDSVWMLTDKKGVLSRIDPATNNVTATIEVPPGSFACVAGDDGAVWISSTENNLVSRVDPKTKTMTDRIAVGPEPRFLTAGAGSIWTLNQGDGTVSRVDVKTRKLVTNIQVGIPGTGGEIAFGEGYVWATVFEIPISQIDPATNKVVRQWRGAGGDSIRAALGSVWLSNLRQQNVWRIHPNQLEAGVAVGTLPRTWQTGGPDCSNLPKWQVHEYNPDFFILRESGCTHFEKPFLYLIFGSDRALLEDTGAGEVDTAGIVTEVVSRWAQRNKKDSVPLTVLHSHGHGDHTAGDAQFKDKPNIQFVAATVPEIQKAFGISNWPADIGHIDLGGRMLDVIPIPGHQEASIALYDRATGILLTGDSVYPGRLYVPDFPAFVASNQRLVDFTRDKPVSHILGTHIEQMRTPFEDYPRGTPYQPEEHVLELTRGDLLELNDALAKFGSSPRKIVLPAVTVVPR